MANRAATGERLTAVFMLGCLLFTFPLLSIFNSADEVLGVPVLYAYLFIAWALIVGLMALAVESRR